MARTFNGSTQYIRTSAGGLNGVPFTYGTFATLIRRTAFGSNDNILVPWATGPVPAGYWEFSGANNFSWGGSASTSTFTGSTWILMVATKATGSAAPRYHWYSYATSTWTHENGATNIADGTSNLAGMDIGRWTDGTDYFQGDIAALALYRQWVPNDATVEAAGLHLDWKSWLTTPRVGADRSVVWLLRERNSALILTDATMGGANQTATTAPSVAADSGPLTGEQVQFVQSLGTNQATAASTTTSTVFSGAAKPAVGDLVVFYGSRDDAVSEAATPTGDSFSDGTANAYTKVVAGSGHTDATGGNGQVGVMFFCKLTVAFPAGTNTLTWTHPSVASRACRIEHWQGMGQARALGTSTGTSTAGAPTVTNTTPRAGDLVAGMVAFENSGTQTETIDADTTNGPWSAISRTFSGSSSNATTALTHAKIVTQHKIVHTAGSQTFNVTNSNTTNVDSIAIVGVFGETVVTNPRVVSRLRPSAGARINSNFY